MNALATKPMNSDLSSHAFEEPAMALLPAPAKQARRVLLSADSGYCHLMAILPRDADLDLERVSRLLGGARIQLAGPCDCGSAPDFSFDTIIDTALAGHDFEVELKTGAPVVIRYADFDHRCHPQVAPICLTAAVATD